MCPIAHAASSYQGGTAFFPSSLQKLWPTAISLALGNISNATVDRHVVQGDSKYGPYISKLELVTNIM
jgi:hypothetical protein